MCSTAGAWSDGSREYYEGKAIAGERDYILRIFDFYSQIERHLQAGGEGVGSPQLSEDYTSAILLPACARCAKLLRRGHDTEVMLAYFRLLEFTQSSASEDFGWSIAEIFLANPALVEDAFGQLTPEQKCIGFAQLSNGFENVTYDKAPSAATKQLGRRLARMKPSCK